MISQHDNTTQNCRPLGKCWSDFVFLTMCLRAFTVLTEDVIWMNNCERIIRMCCASNLHKDQREPILLLFFSRIIHLFCIAPKYTKLFASECLISSRRSNFSITRSHLLAFRGAFLFISFVSILYSGIPDLWCKRGRKKNDEKWPRWHAQGSYSVSPGEHISLLTAFYIPFFSWLLEFVCIAVHVNVNRAHQPDIVIQLTGGPWELLLTRCARVSDHSPFTRPHHVRRSVIFCIQRRIIPAIGARVSSTLSIR